MKMRSIYSKLTTPAFIPSISEGIRLNLQKLMVYIIKAIQAFKNGSVMFSAYDLMLGKLLSSYGENIVRKKKSIHENFGFKSDTIVFLDSGGFESINLHGGLLWEDPLDIYAFQKIAKADVWVILDHPTQPKSSLEENKQRINQTIDFARMINRIHTLDTTLVAVAHGYNQESLINCAKELTKLENVGVIAIPVREPFGTPIKTKLETIVKIREYINLTGSKKYLHLLGCGRMRLWPFYVLCGVNTFDATNWLAYKANPQNLSWDKHPKRVNARCTCEICIKYPEKTVEEVCQMGPVFRLRHNLFFVKQVMDEIRKRLKDGILHDYAKSLHPKLYLELIRSLKRKNNLLELFRVNY